MQNLQKGLRLIKQIRRFRNRRMIEESIIMIGTAFWLVYFATTFENDWIKLFLKLFSSLIIMLISFVPLVEVELSNKKELYDLFAWSVTNGMIFFLCIWFIILLFEAYMFFLDSKKTKLEGTQ